MGQVIYLPHRAKHFNRRVVEQPRVTSASLEYNRVMHLRAHGWNSRIWNCETEQWWHHTLANGETQSFDEAWKIQKMYELERKYWGKS